MRLLVMSVTFLASERGSLVLVDIWVEDPERAIVYGAPRAVGGRWWGSSLRGTPAFQLLWKWLVLVEVEGLVSSADAGVRPDMDPS